jgi:hypothetical protein
MSVSYGSKRRENVVRSVLNGRGPDWLFGKSALQTVHCKQCIANSALQTVHWKQCIANSALQTVHCKQCFANSALQTVHCKQCIANSALQTVHCKQCIANSALQTVHFKQEQLWSRTGIFSFMAIWLSDIIFVSFHRDAAVSSFYFISLQWNKMKTANCCISLDTHKIRFVTRGT